MNPRNLLLKYPVEAIFSFLFLIIACVINLQFLDGANINRHITGHDEYLTIREVYSIFEPISFKHFIMAIISGDIIYYGRVMFYVDALISWIPYKMGGIEAMVFSIRTIHSLFILMALLILNSTFIKGKLYSFLFLFGCLGLHFTWYFIQMPKPEPIQLLFLALFFRYFIKNNFNYGTYFIWLGLAFAAKFNVIVLLPFIFLLPIINNWSSNILIHSKNTFKGLAWFFTGFFMGIPCLLLSPIQPMFLESYIEKTILGSKKTYDNIDLSIYDWMREGLGYSYLGNSWASYLFLLTSLIIMIYLGYNFIKNKKMELSFVLIVCGLALTMIIMFTTKRLWPHYLWTGYVFIWLGLIKYIDYLNLKINKNVYSTGMFFFFSLSMYGFLKNSLNEFWYADKKQEAIFEKKSGENLYSYIEKKYKGKNIGLDGTVFYPYKYYILSKLYHPFSTKRPVVCETCVSWHGDNLVEIWDNNDLVIFNKRHPPDYKNKKRDNYTPDNLSEIIKKFEVESSTHFKLDTIIGPNWLYRKL
jgi:hypothetical protein